MVAQKCKKKKKKKKKKLTKKFFFFLWLLTQNPTNQDSTLLILPDHMKGY